MGARIILLPYDAGDEARFTPRADFAAEARVNAWDWTQGPPPGRTWTLRRIDGWRCTTLGMAGAIPGPRNVWALWALLAGQELTPREWLRAIALARIAMDALVRFNHARGFTAMAREASPAAVRVLERLGFETVTVGALKVDGADVVYRWMGKAA